MPGVLTTQPSTFHNPSTPKVKSLITKFEQNANPSVDTDSNSTARTKIYEDNLDFRGTQESPVEQPSKKMRVLKLLNSEEPAQPAEEREATVLEDLIGKLKKAAKAKLMYNADASCASTVHFWSGRCSPL